MPGQGLARVALDFRQSDKKKRPCPIIPKSGPVSLHVIIFVCMSVNMFMCVALHVQSDINAGVFLSHSLPYFFLRRGLSHYTWDSLIGQAGWPMSTRDLLVSTSAELWL